MEGAQKKSKSTPLPRAVWWTAAFVIFASASSAFSLKNEPLLGAISLYLSWAGLGVSIIGFIIAVDQIKRSATASEAAESAIIELRAKLSSLNAISEVEKAKSLLDEVTRHVENEQWHSARSASALARQAFVRLNEIDNTVYEDLKGRIEASISELDEMCDKIILQERGYIKRVPSLIRQYVDITNRIHVRMTRG